MTLNVCGLKSKIDIPEFTDLIQKYDIVTLVETKCDNTDEIWIVNYFNQLGYKVNINNRFDLSVRKSGGIIVAVRNYIANYITRSFNVSNLIQWIEFDNDLWNLDKNVLFGGTYLPPETSQYGGIHLFDELNNEFIDVVDDDLHCVILTGDLNAYTRTMPDYIVQDNYMVHELTLEFIFEDAVTAVSELERLGISQRYNSDNKVNNYGNRLIDFCKTQNLLIANGRFGNDQGDGKCTCFKGDSKHLVEYFLLSPLLLGNITDFDVLDFDKLFSDVHSPVSCSLTISTAVENDQEDFEMGPNKITRKTKWLKEKISDFKEALTMKTENINKLNSDLTLNIIVIEQANRMLCKMLNGTAKEVMGERSIHPAKAKRHDGNKINNPQIAGYRKIYSRAKRYHRQTRSDHSRTERNRAFRQYKREINLERKRRDQLFNKELRALKNANPREYWKHFRKNKGPNCKATLGDLFNFYHALNQAPTETQNINLDEIENHVILEGNILLNRPITADEIVRGMNRLKNNKAAGIDEITNEILKSSLDVILPTLLLMFNNVLDTGHTPECWNIGIIKPIYKGKGVMTEPSNYRGITLLSCLAKLFTSILNDRLNEYLEVFGILSINQAAFRKNHSITDHIFTMKCLIDQFFQHKRRLYCVFIDFEKCFDKIWRKALWHKLIQQGVTGKILQVIYNIYQNAKSTIELNGEYSDYFQSFRGIRQGENLSPILFSMFVNDLEDYLYENKCDSLNFCRNDNTHWFKLFMLFYADDTVLLAESPKALQLMLNNVSEYCKLWKLTINTEKTKAIIFQKRKTRNSPKFYLDGSDIELVDNFRYLGVIFNYNGSFNMCRKTLVSHASKAMFFVLKKVRQYSLDIDLAIQLFDSMVTSILTFNCEVWGCENIAILETVQLRFFKYLLKLKRGTPNIFIYGELGRYPLGITVKCRMVKFWAKLLNSTKLSSRIYTVVFASHANGKPTKWSECIQRTLEQNGLGEFWADQRCLNPEYLSMILSTRLRDQYSQNWAAAVWESRTGIFYRSFKTEFGFENYLRALPDNLKIPLCRFRCSNHPLPIETGRYDGTAREDRLCTKCDMQCTGDDFHFILECPFFNTLRSNYIKPYYRRNPSMLKYGQLFNSSGITRKNLALFIRNGLKFY